MIQEKEPTYDVISQVCMTCYQGPEFVNHLPNSCRMPLLCGIGVESTDLDKDKDTTQHRHSN